MSFIFIFLIGRGLFPDQCYGSLITNGSFEVGYYGWSPVIWLKNAIEETDASYHGKKCLHLHGQYQYGNDWRYSQIQSQFFQIEGGESYRIAFYAKSNKAGEHLRLNLINYNPVKQDNNRIEKSIVFNLGISWQKYEMKYIGINSGRTYCLLEFDIGNSTDSIWIDAVSVDKVDKVDKTDTSVSNSFQQLDVGLYVNDSGWIIINKPVEISTLLYLDHTENQLVMLEYNVYDYYDKCIKSWNRNIVIRQSSGKDIQVWLPNTYGIFRIEVKAKDSHGNIIGLSEDVFSVLPRINASPSSSPFGVHVPLTPDMAELAHNLGFSWVRIHDMDDFTNWYRVEPLENIYKWYDDKVLIAKQYHLNILGMIEKTPRWAVNEYDLKQKNNKYTNSPPGDISKFGAYVYRLVDHYKDNIHYWEIWNEPHHEGFWSGTPEQYVDLLRVAYNSAKRADPNSVIVAPAGTFEFIDKLFKLGAYNYFDILSYHHYFQNDGPWNSISNEQEILIKIDSMMKHYGVHKPIWNTEGGIKGDSFYHLFIDAKKESRSYFLKVDDYTYSSLMRTNDNRGFRFASEMIIKWYALNISEGVDKCFYYYMREDGKGLFELRNQYPAILEYDRKSKAHGVAVAILSNMLGSDFKFYKKTIKRMNKGDVTWIIFSKGRSPLVICWWDNLKTGRLYSKIAVPETIAKVYNIMGNMIMNYKKGNDILLPVQSEPIYITFKEGTSLTMVDNYFNLLR